MKALSLRQPWADAVLYGGKRIENRIAWSNSNFRGEFLIHAAKGMTTAEYANVLDYLAIHRIDWAPKPIRELVRGAIVGRARVAGVVRKVIPQHPKVGEGRGVATLDHAVRELTLDEAKWWMGSFALVLDDVVPFEKPIPWSGALGFFATPFDRDGRRVA